MVIYAMLYVMNREEIQDRYSFCLLQCLICLMILSCEAIKTRVKPSVALVYYLYMASTESNTNNPL